MTTAPEQPQKVLNASKVGQKDHYFAHYLTSTIKEKGSLISQILRRIHECIPVTIEGKHWIVFYDTYRFMTTFINEHDV